MLTFKQLQGDSTEVEQEGVLQHYAARPKQIEELCLTDYVSYYRRAKKSGRVALEDKLSHDDKKETDEEDRAEDTKVISLCNGYVLQKRRKQADIRYVHFSEDKDREKHFREILMLFQSWRVDDAIIGSSQTWEEKYQQIVKETPQILDKMKEYNHHSETLDQAIAAVESIKDSDLEEQWDKVAPNTQYVEVQNEHESTIHTDIYPSLKLHDSSDIGFDLGLKQKNTTDMDVVINMLPEKGYTDMGQSFNLEQKQVFYYVVHWLKTKTDPLYV